MFSYHTCCIWSLQLNLKETYWRFDGLAGSRFIVSEKKGGGIFFLYLFLSLLFLFLLLLFLCSFLFLFTLLLHPCNNLHSLIAASRRHNEATIIGRALVR